MTGRLFARMLLAMAVLSTPAARADGALLPQTQTAAGKVTRYSPTKAPGGLNLATPRGGASGPPLSAYEINVRMFGAIGDPAFDSTQALAEVARRANAVLAAGSSVRVTFPTGVYQSSKTLSFRGPKDTYLVIHGEGRGSELRYTGTQAGDGMATVGSVNPVLEGGLLISKGANAPIGGEAFDVLGDASAWMPSAHLENLSCASSLPQNAPWHSCLHLQNSNMGVVSNLHYESGAGKGNGDPSQGVAVWLDGRDGGYTIDNHFYGVLIEEGFAGYLVTGHVEGVQSMHDTIVGSAYGVFAPGRDIASLRPDLAAHYTCGTCSTLFLWLSFTGSHVNSRYRGLYLNGARSAKITGNLFYQNGDADLPPAGAWLAADTAAMDPQNAGHGMSYAAVSGADMYALDVSHNEINGSLNSGIPVKWGVYSTGVGWAINVSHNYVDTAASGCIYTGAGDSLGTISGNVCNGVGNPGIVVKNTSTSQAENLVNSGVADIGLQNGIVHLGPSGVNFDANGDLTLPDKAAIFFGTGDNVPILNLDGTGSLSLYGRGTGSGNFSASGTISGANLAATGALFVGKPTAQAIVHATDAGDVELYGAGDRKPSLRVPSLVAAGKVCLDTACNRYVYERGDHTVVVGNSTLGDVFSIDPHGNVIAKGSITQNGTP